MTGMHQVLITLTMALLATNGFDSCVFAGAMIANAATYGMSFGAFLRLRSKEEKSSIMSYFISAVVGGITEPTLYGCGFKYGRSFAGLICGGFIGGLISGIAGVKIYVLSNASVMAVIAAYAGGGMNNLVWILVSDGTAFVAASAITYLFGFTKEQLDANAAAAAQIQA